MSVYDRTWLFVDGADDQAVWKVWAHCESKATAPHPFIVVYARTVRKALDLGRKIHAHIPRGRQGYVMLYACSPLNGAEPLAVRRNASVYAVRLITVEKEPLTYEQFLEWHAQHIKDAV